MSESDSLPDSSCRGLGMPSFVFSLATGSTGMFNANDRERNLPFTKANAFYLYHERTLIVQD